MTDSPVKFKSQQNYVASKRDEGLLRPSIWVPADMVDEIKDVALLMRQGEWVMLEEDEKPVLDKISAARRNTSRA